MTRAWWCVLFCLAAPALLGQTVGFSLRSTSSISEAAGPANVVLARSGDTAGTTTVTLRFEPGSAHLGEDFQAAQTTVTFAPGEAEKTVAAVIINDAFCEPTESFRAVLSSVSGGSLSDVRSWNLEIRDDDPPVRISFAPGAYVFSEGDGWIALTLIRSGSTLEESVAVLYPGPGTNFYPSEVRVVFPPGVTSVAVPVAILQNDRLEGDQPHDAAVAPVSNALSGDSVTIRIRDDEPASWLALATTSYDVIESAGSVAITVRRTGDRSHPASVDYATGYFDRNPAFTGLDYTPVSGTLAFAPGEETKSFSIPILDDTKRDGPRLFGVGLSSPKGAFLPNGTAWALVSIADDEPNTFVSFAETSVRVAENAKFATLTLVRTGALDAATTVKYSALPRLCPAAACPEPSAEVGRDFTPVQGKITFAPGETTKTLSVPILDDARQEEDESFDVYLYPDFEAIIQNGQAAVRIIDNDSPPLRVLSLAPPQVSVTEGKSASVEVSCTGLTAPLTVPYWIAADVNARAGEDFVAAEGSVILTPEQPRQTIVVQTLDDHIAEETETIELRVGSSDPTVVPDANGTTRYIAIRDDDPHPVITISDPVIAEGDSGLREALFTISLSAPFDSFLQLHVTTADRSATAGSDYMPLETYVYLGSAGTTATVRVPIIGDTRIEGDEAFVLRAAYDGDPTFWDVPVVAKEGVATIKDDDVAFTVADTGVNEGDSGIATAAFTVRLSAPLAVPASVDYRTGDGTALGGSDYEQVHGTLHFAPGETSKRITVPVHGDTTAEADETILLRLSNASGAAIAGGAQCVIVNDDPYFTLHSDLEYADGQHLDLYVPTSGAAPHPLIVWVGSAANPAVRETARGFAVASIRQSARIEDAKAAVRWLRANAARFSLDEQRFIAWGGELAALLGTTAGVASLEDPGQGNAAVSSAVQAVIAIGAPTGRAIAFVTPDDPPFFIAHGAEDAEVAPEESGALHRALLAAGVPSTLKIVEGAGHSGIAWDAIDGEIDAFLDATASAPRRRSAGR